MAATKEIDKALIYITIVMYWPPIVPTCVITLGPCLKGSNSKDLRATHLGVELADA